MRRDLDLIRKILLAIEESKSTPAFKGVERLAQAIGEKDCALVSFHVSLLIDSNYIEARKFNSLNQPYQDYSTINRITNYGFDYLDRVRNDDIWNATKEKIKSVGGSATLEVIKSLAEKVINSQLGI